MLSNVRQSDIEVFGDCAGWFDYLQQICVIHTLNGQHVHMHASLYNHDVLKITYCHLFLLPAVNFKIVVMKVAAHACRAARFAYISRHWASPRPRLKCPWLIIAAAVLSCWKHVECECATFFHVSSAECSMSSFKLRARLFEGRIGWEQIAEVLDLHLIVKTWPKIWHRKSLVIQVMPKDLLRTEALFFPAVIRHCWKPINTVSNFKRGWGKRREKQ